MAFPQRGRRGPPPKADPTQGSRTLAQIPDVPGLFCIPNGLQGRRVVQFLIWKTTTPFYLMALVFELGQVNRCLCLHFKTVTRKKKKTVTGVSCRKCNMQMRKLARWELLILVLSMSILRQSFWVSSSFKFSISAKRVDDQLFQCLEIHFVFKKRSYR